MNDQYCTKCRQMLPASMQTVSKADLHAESHEIVELIRSSSWPSSCIPPTDCSHVLTHVIEENLGGKSFLDFGCGDGKTTTIAANSADIAVGYDLQYGDSMSRKNLNLYFSSNWQSIKDKGPYDVILLYDVLDHANVSDGLDAPGLLLKKIVDELLAKNGKVYMMVHPWCGRAGSHMYEFNKAYAHIILTQWELKYLGLEESQKLVHKVVRPKRVYWGWIEDAGLKIVNERVTQIQPEEFFRTPLLTKRIMDHTQFIDDSGNATFPEFQLSVQYIDYTLGRK